MGDSSVVFPAFELILVAKNLERIGDHATNIAKTYLHGARSRRAPSYCRSALSELRSCSDFPPQIEKCSEQARDADCDASVLSGSV